uniref:Uncharacterized protein n=1 Tax=Picea glauca TaxID=3330 RepID=A0A124GNK1_PICGL|nr:hypothetical protein ABT39_MTgene4394 [Picea glauca]
MLEWKLGFDFLSSVSMDRTTNCDVFNSTSWGLRGRLPSEGAPFLSLSGTMSIEYRE